MIDFEVKTRFEFAIDQLIQQGYAIVDQWLSADMLKELSAAINERYDLALFSEAKIGNDKDLLLNTSIRGDKIFWLDQQLAIPVEKEFLCIMDDFSDYLNYTCFAGIKLHEFHYAVYQPGTRYARHKDQFRSNDSRKYSMVLYLNEGWQQGDGGELMIYTNEDVKVEPLFGRLVFFRSELEHEVLLSNFERKSLTGWLKDHI